jgi:hypothetical protein
MDEAGALALVSKYRSAIWKEWRRLRDSLDSTDLVAILKVSDQDQASVMVITRGNLLNHLGHVHAIPDTIKIPAGMAPPVVPNSAALWVFVLKKGEVGICLRMTESRLVKGGFA